MVWLNQGILVSCEKESLPGVPVGHVQEVADEFDVIKVTSGIHSNQLPARSIEVARLDAIVIRVHPEDLVR